MQIDDTLLTRLEKLSFITVEESKREEIIAQLSGIVDFVENLSELDTEAVDDKFAMNDSGTPTRDDVPASDRSVNDSIIEHAPNAQDHFFIVPKIIE